MANNSYHSSHAVSDTSMAPLLLGLVGTLQIISLGLLIARTWTRTHPTVRLGWDDLTIFVATLIGTTNYLMLLVATFHGYGRHTAFVSLPQRMIAGRLVYWAQILWCWSITLVKMSIAFLLLRFKTTRAWKWFLHAIITALWISAVVNNIFQFLQCQPYSVYWDPTIFKHQKVRCWSHTTIDAGIIGFSAVTVTTDVIFSLIPLTFITTLRRPTREKVAIILLMALGLTASAASIARIIQLRGFYTSTDLFYKNTTLSLFAMMEQQLGLIAATIPTLKSLFERLIAKIQSLLRVDEGAGPSLPSFVDRGWHRLEAERIRGGAVGGIRGRELREGSVGKDLGRSASMATEESELKSEVSARWINTS